MPLVKVKVSAAQLCPQGLWPARPLSVHGILQARMLQWLAISLLQGIFSTQGWNSGLLRGRLILRHLSHQGSPAVTLTFIKLP